MVWRVSRADLRSFSGPAAMVGDAEFETRQWAVGGSVGELGGEAVEIDERVSADAGVDGPSNE
jgi:hypothetical protein